MEEAIDVGSDGNTSDTVNNGIITTPMESVLSHSLCESVDDGRRLSDAKSQRCILENMNLWLGIAIVAVCIIPSWLLLGILPKTMKEDIKEGLILRQNATTRWTRPNVNTFMSLRGFEILKSDDKVPGVKEIGPFVYRVEVHRTNVTWHSNSSVSYREHSTMFFEENLSVGPPPTYLQHFTFMGNESSDHVFNIYTGEVNFSQIYQIFSWNFATKLPFWNSEDGSNIRGTDGSKFQPLVNENSKLTFFYPELRRTFDLEYSESTTFKDLPVYRYTIPNSEFSNSTSSSTRSSSLKGRAESAVNASNSLQSPELGNECRAPSCVPSGTYDIQPGTPFYISLPHFLGADPYYLRLVKGLQPDESKHRSIFEVDKVTGITVNQKRRFQVNIHGPLANNSEVYFPMFWFEMSMQVSDDDLQHIKGISRSLSMVYGICLGLGLVLCLLLAVLVSCLIYRVVKRSARTNKYVRFAAQPDGRNYRVCGCC